MGLGAKVERPRVRPFEARVDVADDEPISVAGEQERDRALHSGAASRRRQQEDRCVAGQRDPAGALDVQPTLQRRDDPADGQDAETATTQPLGKPSKRATHHLPPYAHMIRRTALTGANGSLARTGPTRTRRR